jgi:hypothetical protein
MATASTTHQSPSSQRHASENARIWDILAIYFDCTTTLFLLQKSNVMADEIGADRAVFRLI